jgi:hypothetical protein
MKGVKLGLMILATASLVVAFGGLAYAFHSGGVAECEGCHSMHSPAAGGSSLLVGATKSEACLTCHERAGDTGPTSYHISTATADLTGAPLQRTPGGDFGWLKKVFTYTYSGTTYTETGGGHNINAPANGYNQASGSSPGGSFPASELACNSCHDPHGKYRRLNTGVIATTGAPIWASGSYNNTTNNEPKATGEAVGAYRLLAGQGYTKSGVTFQGVPAAKAPSTYNQTEATNQVRVAYGVKTTNGHVTWSNWCTTCHGAMHSTGNYVHPVDQTLSSTIISNYNSYVKSGDLSGTSATAFTSLVPFATNSGDYTALAALASNNSPTSAGPASGDQVNCLTCHRAHASGFSHMLRFDLGYEFMTKDGQYIGSDNPAVTGSRAPLQHRGRTNAMWQAAYYDRAASQFATYQRVLCNKCHVQD